MCISRASPGELNNEGLHFWDWFPHQPPETNRTTRMQLLFMLPVVPTANEVGKECASLLGYQSTILHFKALLFDCLVYLLTRLFGGCLRFQ